MPKSLSRTVTCSVTHQLGYKCFKYPGAGLIITTTDTIPCRSLVFGACLPPRPVCLPFQQFPLQIMLVEMYYFAYDAWVLLTDPTAGNSQCGDI